MPSSRCVLSGEGGKGALRGLFYKVTESHKAWAVLSLAGGGIGIKEVLQVGLETLTVGESSVSAGGCCICAGVGVIPKDAIAWPGHWAHLLRKR